MEANGGHFANPDDNSDRAIRRHNRIVLAEAVGYYGLLGVAAVSAFLLR